MYNLQIIKSRGTVESFIVSKEIKPGFFQPILIISLQQTMFNVGFSLTYNSQEVIEEFQNIIEYLVPSILSNEWWAYHIDVKRYPTILKNFKLWFERNKNN